MEGKLDLLRRVPFLAGADTDLRRIAALVDIVDVPADRELTTQGSRTEAVYILVDGTATASVDGRRFESIGPGGIVGHVALLDHGHCHATTRTDQDVTLMVIERANFATFVKDDAVLPGLARLLAARMRFAEAELANVHNGTGQLD